jgi:hypothetical protein
MVVAGSSYLEQSDKTIAMSNKKKKMKPHSKGAESVGQLSLPPFPAARDRFLPQPP